MDSSGAPLNINELKRQLQTLGISTSTPGLQGDDRFEELSFRLEVAKKGQSGNTPPKTGTSLNAETFSVPSLNQLSIGEIRARLTALGESTNTPGATGEERRIVLMRKLIDAVCNDNSENILSDSAATKPPEVKVEVKQQGKVEFPPAKEVPPVTPVIVEPPVQPQIVDPAVSSATISALKNDLKRMLNQRALAVASKLSGASQDEQLRSSESVLSRIEMEIAHFKLLQQKGETKLPTESIKSEFLVLNPNAAGFAIEALISRLEGYRNSSKEKIRDHRLRIRQEGDEHPQFGIAAEEKLKILLSEANLSSLSSTSNSSKVSRTRQKISEMKAMETQLEEQGKVSPVKQDAPSGKAAAASALTVATAAVSGLKANVPSGNSINNSNIARRAPPPAEYSGVSSPDKVDKWSTDLLPGSVICMEAPPAAVEKEPTKTDVYASKLPNFTSSFLGKAINLDNNTGTFSSKNMQRPSEKREAPIAPPVKPVAVQATAPSMAPAVGPPESIRSTKGTTQPPSSAAAPPTLPGRRPPPSAGPPSYPEAPVKSVADHSPRPVKFEEEEDAYFQEADEVEVQQKGSNAAQIHTIASQHEQPADTRVPLNRSEYAARQAKHGSAGDERESDADSERGAEDDEETGEFVPDDLPGSDTRSESVSDYGQVYGTHRQINTTEDDDDLEELIRSPLRTGTSNSGSEAGETGADGTAFPFPEAQSPDAYNGLPGMPGPPHRIYSIDEGDAPDSANASADVTPVISRKAPIEKKVDYSAERRHPPSDFTADEATRSPPVKPEDELKFTIPGFRSDAQHLGADEDGDGNGDDDGRDPDADGYGGVGEDPLDDEADREADEKTQIRVLRSHAKVLENLNDIAAAEGVHMRALELDPTNITTLEGFAQFLHQKKGELARAEAFFNRGLQVCLPGLSLRGPNSAHSTPQSSKKAQSTMSFATDSTMQGNKVTHIIKFILSYAHFMSKSKGDIEAASILYKKGVDLAPDNAYLLATYAHFLAQVGDKESMATAVEYFQKALKLSPGNGQYCMWYGKLLKRLGRTGQAELMYKVALEQTKGNAGLEPTAICNYATFIFKQRKDPERAISLFKAGLESYPEHKGLRKNFATVIKAHPHFGVDRPEPPKRTNSSHAADRAERLAQRAMDNIRGESPAVSAQGDAPDPTVGANL